MEFLNYSMLLNWMEVTLQKFSIATKKKILNKMTTNVETCESRNLEGRLLLRLQSIERFDKCPSIRNEEQKVIEDHEFRLVAIRSITNAVKQYQCYTTTNLVNSKIKLSIFSQNHTHGHHIECNKWECNNYQPKGVWGIMNFDELQLQFNAWIACMNCTDKPG